MHNILSRRGFEMLIAISSALVLGFFMAPLSSLDVKFQIAAVVGLTGLVVISLFEARRTICLVLWIILLPLSIEKLVYTAEPIWPGLLGQSIIINAADLILLLLTIFLVSDRLSTGKAQFVWPKHATYLFLLCVWGLISYLMHAVYFADDFVESGPMGLLHLIRNFLVVIAISSAIQDRSDVVWGILAILVIVFFESVLVGLSYLSGQIYNFSKILGQTVELQKYSGSGGQLVRAAGTVGVSTQQSAFHAFYTPIIVSLFAVQNKWIKNIALLVIFISCIAMIMTFSRASWVASSFAGLAIFLIFLKRRQITAYGWLIGVGVAVIGVVVLTMLANPIYDRLTKGDDGSTDSRVRMINLAIDLFKDSPILGVGPGEYPEAGIKLFPPGYKEPEWVALGGKPIVPPLGRVELATSIVPGSKPIIVPLSVHNKYFLTLSELGIVGLILWLGFYWTLFKDAIQCTRSNDKLYAFVGVAGVGCILSSVIYMMLDLFADDKTVEILLFSPVFVSAVARLSRIDKI